ncbi:nuclear transport factor 2 family protein [Streptomyces sp. NPDC055078]
MERNIREKAIQCLRHLEAYEFDGMRAMCTGTATVWHNDGKGDQSIDEKLEQLKPLVPALGSMRYEITRQFENPGEVFQQQILRLALADGSRSEVHAAMYFRFDEDLIDRIEEYSYAMPTGMEPAEDGRQP